MTTQQLDMNNLPVGTLVISKESPQWGTWSVRNDYGDWYSIRGNSGSRVLFKSEAERFWDVAK